MLYVFHVDTGTMMTFDMGLLTESVAKLQKVISQACHISEDKQVLLISGGESLDPSTSVNKYHAGTDTNPIYLFSKMAIEAATPPCPSVHYGSDVDIPSQVEGSLLLPATFGTVVARAQLALQIHDVDTEEVEACEKLVHDQHLQQQGWAAVVANLEDITCALRQRSEIFTAAYNDYMESREEYLVTLSSVSPSLDLLSKIPVLPCLLQEDSDVSLSRSTKNLYEWISSQDPQHCLQDLVQQCVKATEQLDQQVLESLLSEVTETFKQVDNPSMKEVKGIEDRLYGLDQILSGARKNVQEQSDMAQGFVQNQNRVSKLRDTSILPDLCNSHKKQLVVMVNNHKKLQETKKKCKMAKEELSINLHTRLRWVMLVEKRICDVDGKLMIYHENLKRLRKRLDILRQIHEAPQMYAKLVVEVVRRRKFSMQFAKWAKNLAEESQQIHADEVLRRENFLKDIGNHFLQSLFRGFGDFPESFATEVPPSFDQELPHITSEDVNMLITTVPELAQELQVPIDDVYFLMKEYAFEKSQFGDEVKISRESENCQLATSDIEIINSCDEHFLTTDQSLSLGEQVASSELNQNLLIQIQKENDFDKPENLMPKSLSEELTKEMKISSRKDVIKGDNFSDSYNREGAIKTGADDSAKKSGSDADVNCELFGASTSSGEQLKSTESDISGHDKVVDSAPPDKKRSRKHTLQDMETSQEFTTADFYIEDSMPSSIADSPTGKSDSEKQKRDLLSLEEKTEFIKKLENRIQSLLNEAELSRSQIELSKNKIEKLIWYAHGIEKIKEEFSDISQCMRKNKDIFSCELENTMTVILSHSKDIIQDLQANFDSVKQEQKLERENFKEREKDILFEFSEREKALQLKISEQEMLLKNLNNEIENLKTNAIESEKKFVEEKDSLDQEKKEMETQYKNQIDDIVKQNSLELEVEIDKLRSEFQDRICELENSICERETTENDLKERIQVMSAEKIKTEEELMEKFQKEKEDITKILESEFQEKLTKKIEENSADLESRHLSEIEKIKKSNLEEREQLLKQQEQKLVEEKENEIDEFTKQMNAEFEKSYNVLKENLEEEHRKIMEVQMLQKQKQYETEKGEQEQKFSEEKENILQQLRFFSERETSQKEAQTEEQVVSQHAAQTDETPTTQVEMQTDQWQGVEMVTQTEDKPLVQQEAQTSLPMEEEKEETITTQDHRNQMTMLEVRLTAEKEKALIELKQKYEKDIGEMISKLEREKSDSLSSVINSLQAEKQVSFNEALAKVTQEKDKVIEDLKQKEGSLMEQLSADKGTIQKLTDEKSKLEDIKSRAMSHLTDKEREFSTVKRKLEDELALTRQQLSLYQSEIQTMSAVTAGPSVMEISHTEDFTQARYSTVEEELKAKKEEIATLQQKLCEISMTTSTKNVVQDKVSITSCNIGDLALFCLDDRHDQYVVFTIGSILHFLHSDCQETLGLKTNPGESRKSWVLAEITDKEYCQAKKPQNRFKVPVGTKFYRVKAKSWNPETVTSTRALQTSTLNI